MDCTNCGQPYGDSDIFCGICGADLRAQRAASAPPTAPVAQPPATSPAPPPFPAPPPVSAQQPPAAAAPRSSKTLWIILGILAALLTLCLLCSGGGYLLWKRSPLNPGPAVKTPSTEQRSTPSDVLSVPSTTQEATAGGSDGRNAAAFETPDEAMKQVLPAGWVLRKAHEGPQQVEYWGGPPNSEFTTVYLVNAQPSGGWLMAESYPLEVVNEGP